jgi:hypothetical protein
MHLLPGAHGSRHFEGASAAGRIRVRSADLAVAPAVVVASERMAPPTYGVPPSLRAESRPGDITAPVRYFSTSTSTYQRVPA